MLEKIKSRLDPRYTKISIYTTVTVLLIFILIFISSHFIDILKYSAGVLSYIGSLLTPVFIGVVIVYVLSPLVDLFERLYRKGKFLKLKNEKKYRTFAVFSCILLILVVLFLIIGVFIFSITRQISSMNFDGASKVISSYINSFTESLKGIEEKLAYYNIESGTVKNYITNFSSMLIKSLSNFADNLTVNALNITRYVSNTLIGIIVAIYLLLEKNVFVGYLDMLSRALLKERTQIRLKGYWHDFDKIFSGYIRGQLIDALFMSVVLSISLSVIGIKFGALIGVLAGLCNLIPYFGPIVAFAGTIFFGLLNAQYSKVLIAIIVLLIVQQVDGNIIGPRFMSDGVALKPVFILIAVIIGSQVGGVAGMVLAVPVAAFIKLFLKRYIEARLKAKETLKEQAS